MKFSLAIYAAPAAPAARTALDFVDASLAAGHDIYRLFFLSEGVTNALVDEPSSLAGRWAELITRKQLDAVVCVNSAQQHGISVDGRSGRTLVSGFVIGGLAQLIDGALNADRFITFG